MDRRRVLVVGAAGDVGQGIVAAALASGRQVIAAGRDPAKLARLAARHSGAALAAVAGDIASHDGAVRLWDEAARAFGGIDVVIVSVNAGDQPRRLLDWEAEDLAGSLHTNLLTHFVAAKAFLPRLPATGALLGIGGGTADFIFPGLAPVSMAQAALRMLYRGLAKEHRDGPIIRELLIASMVAGESNRAAARPEWVTDVEVGQHVCTILDDPAGFARPVLELRSREQVGHPEAS